uniref:Uncharacterized protein n=1 Tax=Nymphaea colorata TaxID=210225 RepID=A0A5K1BDC8_9MAGN
MGTPKRPKLSMPDMEKARSSQVAELSPVQWAVCTPEPTNVDRDKTNGLFWVTLARAIFVARASVKPYSP